MKTDEIREKYLDYFTLKQHTRVASDSLVPQNDPTLLFSGAGMNQFKEYFLGIKKDLKRATSSQKCLRTGDLEEVGRTAYHHSFFEMLGNFSFGDYFKEGAIEMAWEFLTKELKLDPKRLRISVHNSDDEAYKLWSEKIGIRKDWIYKLGDKDNFWPANAPKDGPNGPCGPCSEIYYDQNPSLGDGGDLEQTFEEQEDGKTVKRKRFAEIWNLVFTQFDRQDGGKLVPLAQKNIDTGMGLERLACMIQGQKTNYEIDIFRPINEKIEELLLGKGKKVTGSTRMHLYAISDHARAVTFSMADGVIPSNEGRGYVIRKLIRRALWRAHQIKPMQELDPFLYQLVPTIASVMKTYPELKDAAASIAATLKGEEERFLDTFETGSKLLENKLAQLKSKVLPGEVVFELYDTYGFPDELTNMILQERGMEIDKKGFDKAMDEQRKRAKDTSKMKGDIFATTDLEKVLHSLPPTEFTGYHALEGEGKVLHVELDGKKGIVILDKSPFYAESGGQVGDYGVLKGNFEAKVTDTQKKDKYSVHYIELISGTPKAGDKVKGIVDKNRRERSMRNHTATHLLHAALRNILGPQVRQLGSLVAPDKLRFDYSYGQALTAEQIKQIEDSVNAEILKDTDVSKEEKELEEAKKEGALAFFGEKYGKTVRVVSIPGYSKEFCGGTHCDRTGQIGSFVIVSDSSIASGTRRIEALTGEGAIEYLRNLKSQITQLSQTLKTTPDKLAERTSKLKKLEKEVEKGGSQGQVTASSEKSASIGGRQFTASSYKELTVDGLRKQSDYMRSSTAKTVYFLAAENEDKIQFIVGLSHDLLKDGLDLRDFGKKVAQILEGSCGGRADMVQGGAPNKGQLAKTLDEIVNAAKKSF
jgi:alanyl-tRNA synthetase